MKALIILNFLKKLNPYISPILVCILLYITASQFFENKKLSKEARITTARVTTATKIIERYRDTTGASHLVIQDNIVSRKQKLTLDKNSGLIDTVARALQIAKQRITELTKINATLYAANLKGKKDDANNEQSVIRYTDRYADIYYNPVDTTFGLKYDLNLFTTGYTRRRGFLGLTRTKVLDLYSPDERITINGVQRFSVEVPDPAFGARLQAKTQYNVNSGTFLPAATVEFNYKKFTLEGNYFYNTRTKKFVPVIGAKVDILKF